MADLVRDTLENYSAASNLMHNEKIREMMASGQTIYHFGFGQSPFPIMNKAADRLAKHASESAYLPVAGIEALRVAIRNFHNKYDSISFSADDVIVGPGSKELIFLLMNIFQGDILVISPSWTSYKPQVMLSGHKANVVPTSMEDEWKIRPEKFTQYLKDNNLSGTKLLIMNNPDNPTGTLYTQKELSDLSEVFKKEKVIVLSDEIYGRLTFDDSFVSMAKVYPEGTILCSGMSKWASMGGWRVGYHVYPEKLSSLKNAVRSAASHTYTTVAAPIQYAVAEDYVPVHDARMKFIISLPDETLNRGPVYECLTLGTLKNQEKLLELGHLSVLNDLDTCEAYMRHTCRIMAAAAQYCHKELSEVGVSSVKPKGGFYIFPNFEILRAKLKARGIERCEDMVKALFDETSVSVMAGGPAFLRPETELTIRLCYVNFDGAKALAASEKIGLESSLPENFVQSQCSQLYDGIQVLKQWAKKTLES